MMKTSVVLFIVCVAAVTANQQREELRKNQAAAPVALVTKEKADLIAVDEDNVYWVSDKAAIRKVSKSGGTPETLVAGEMEIKEIIVNGDQIFFRTDRELRRVSRQGGSPTTLAAYNGDCYRCLAVDDINVYFINWPDASSGQLMKVSKEGSALIVLASGIRFPKGLAADGKRVYWVDYANDSIKSEQRNPSHLLLLTSSIF